MTTNEALDKYLGSLPNSVRIAKSRDIRESLEISKFVLSSWRSGRTPLKRFVLDKISEIVGVDLMAGVDK